MAESEPLKVLLTSSTNFLGEECACSSLVSTGRVDELEAAEDEFDMAGDEDTEDVDRS